MQENNVIKLETDNPNEILNTPPKQGKKRISKRRVLSFIVLGVLIAVVIAYTWGTIVGNEALSLIRRPRLMTRPISILFTYIIIIIKPDRYKAHKTEILKIIEEFNCEKVAISDIMKKYREGKRTYQNVEDKYVQIEVSHRIIDLLWAGMLPGYKYVLDIDSVVRIENIENANESEKNEPTDF